MRRIWPILALAVVGVAVFLIVRGTKPAGPRAGPVAPAGLPAKAAPDVVSPGAPAEAGEETAAPALEPLRGEWTIEGRVVREREGEAGDLDPTLEPAREPVAGAAIRVRLAPPEEGEETPPPRAPREVTTGPDGRFAVVGLPGKTRLEMEVDAPGNALKVILQRLEGTEPYRDIGDIVLRPASTLIVRLVDRDGMPVEGGRIIINDLGEDGPDAFSESPREAIERGSGEYTVDRLAPVHCSVEASATGWAPSLTWVELPRAEPLVVRLGEGTSLTGTVRASTGEPIAYAQVVAKDDRTFPDVECETDASGRFQLRGLREDIHKIEATADGFHRATRFFENGENLEIWLIREAIVEGKVVAEEDGRPLAGVSVQLDVVGGSAEWIEATTDARGEFLLRKLLPGAYNADFDHDDYLPVRQGPWELVSGEELSGVVIQLRRGFTVHGTVANAETGEPVPGATVWAQLTIGKDAADLLRGGSTNSNGTFELSGLAPGECVITVKAPTYLKAELKRRIVSEDAGNLALTLEKGGSITGRVLDHAGRPVKDVKLFLEGPRNAPPAISMDILYGRHPSVPDNRGRYVIDRLPPFDDYGVVAIHDELGSCCITGIAVPSGTAVTGMDLRFPAGGSVRGRVFDQTGQGLEGVTVQMTPDDRELPEPPRQTLLSSRLWDLSSRSATTGGNGTYEIGNIAAGLYRVSAAAPGWASWEKEPVRIVQGLAVEGMDFVFAGGESAAGRIVDTKGLGIAQADIEIHWEGRVQYTASDADGRFLMRGLPTGKVDVFAGKKGFRVATARIALPSDNILLELGPVGRISGRLEARGKSAFQEGEVWIRNFREGRAPDDTFARTDESGRFSASVEPGPSILVIAEIPGFARSEVETALAPGEHREVVVPLRRGGAIEGTVVSRESGEPVESADVHLEAPGDSRAGMMTLADDTDGRGGFSIDDVPEGPVIIVVRHAKRRVAREAIHVLPGETVEARIELEGGQGIHGRVSRLGKPLAGARVAALRTDGSPAGEAVSSPGGLYEVLGLAPGEHDVSVETVGPGGRPLVLRRRVNVAEGRLTERDLDLGAVLLSGRVLRNGALAAGVDIAASILGEEIEDGTVSTDASGEYSLELPGGREVDLSITADGKTLAEIDLVLPDGPGELRRDIDLGAR